MDNFIKKLDKTKVSIIGINDDLKKYKNDRRFKKKLDEANKMIAEIGMPDIYYQSQAKIAKKHRYTDTLVEQELSVAHEPTPVYGKLKEEEK